LMVAAGAVIPVLIESLSQIELTDSSVSIIMGIVIMLLKYAQKVLSDRTYIVQK